MNDICMNDNISYINYYIINDNNNALKTLYVKKSKIFFVS